jgi:hypothetical protein
MLIMDMLFSGLGGRRERAAGATEFRELGNTRQPGGVFCTGYCYDTDALFLAP